MLTKCKTAPGRGASPFFVLLLLVLTALLACRKSQQNTASTTPPEPEFFAGHSLRDSTGEIADRKVHYDSLLVMLNDPFAGKDELGPAHKRIGHYGIDVSHYQRDIDWPKVLVDSVPHPIKFVMIKATQGKSMVDSHFKENWASAKKHGFRIGAYHFYRYKDDPLEQAANYIRQVTLAKGDILPIIDVELDCAKCTQPEIPTAQMIADLKKFIGAIEQHYKVKPIIYTYQGFYHTYLSGHFTDHYFWMALYSSKPPKGWVTPLSNAPAAADPRIALWQFTDSGKVPGITGTVDMNFLIGQFENNILIQ